MFIPPGATTDETPPLAGYAGETPESIACHYILFSETLAPNCNASLTTEVPVGGSNSIAIVDAYDDPAAPGDLAWFSLQFGLPLTASQFQVIWANTANSSCNVSGVPTDFTGGSELEESVDIEWSHAMAPKANIYLVEACSLVDTDLQQAILVANNLVQCGSSEIDPSTLALGSCPGGSTGKGEVSMSWGMQEFIGENASDGCATLNDSCFTTPNVVYIAAAGDSPGVIWPCTSPNVVCAGGTTIRRNPVTLNFEQETAWVFTGGGQSAIETIPSYQSGVASVASTVGSWRGVPDLSFDSDPYTGVYVYDTFPLEGVTYREWTVEGGTSVATASLAGIVNNAASRSGIFAASSNAELTTIYTNITNDLYFTDIKNGFCGYYMGFTAGTGWDFCTGVGVDRYYNGK
jgi:subtilase family serine protease